MATTVQLIQCLHAEGMAAAVKIIKKWSYYLPKAAPTAATGYYNLFSCLMVAVLIFAECKDSQYLTTKSIGSYFEVAAMSITGLSLAITTATVAGKKGPEDSINCWQAV